MMSQSLKTDHSSPPTNPKQRKKLTGVQKRQIKTFITAMLFLLPSLFIFATFVFIPLVRSFILSGQLTDPIGRPAAFIGLENYRRLFNTPVFMNSFKTSLKFVLYMVPSTIFISLLLALLGNLRLKGIAAFRIFFSITIAISAATASLIFMYLYHPTIGNINYLLSLIGISNVPWLISEKTALIAVVIPSVWLQMGLNTVILMAAMQGIPEELYESAMIDGANAWHKFRSITLPMLSSTFFFLLVVDMLASFQTFTQVEIMTKGGPLDSTNVLVFSIYREFYFNGRYGFAAAQAIMLFLVMLAITIFQFTVVERKVFYE